MLSYSEAEDVLIYILNYYIKGIEDKKIIFELIKSGSWKAAIYEIDKKKFRSLTEDDHQKLKDIFGLYC